MPTTEAIEDRWRLLLATGEAGTREVDAESPLRMVIGVSELGRPFFTVITSVGVEVPDVPPVIEVSRRRRQADGRWTLTMELRSRHLTDAFISLVSDLAAKSVLAGEEEPATRIFFDTLAEWKDLLAAASDRISEGALRGLIAELWFGWLSGLHPHSPADTARAWVGPLKADQDFQFKVPGFRYEVKSQHPLRSEVEISSENQLEGDDVRLVVVALEEASSPIVGVSLPEVVASIRSQLADPVDRAEFNRKFASLGVNIDDPWYGLQTFRVSKVLMFEVRDGFPAIRRSDLPKAVSSVRYRLDVSQAMAFGVEHAVNDQ